MTSFKQSPDSVWKRSSETCMKLTSAKGTVETPDDGHGRCPKHVEFCNRINLENECIWLVI